jgi:hypothetical protein
MADVEVRSSGLPTTTEEAETKEVKTARQVAIGGSATEAFAGVGAIVLSILGLAGVLPVSFAAIAALALGAAILLEGGSIGARLFERSSVPGETAETSGGMSAEALAGLAVIVLGILALVGMAPVTLLAVSSIVLGAGLLGGAVAQMGFYRTSTAREAMTNASGGHVLVGIAAIVLGIFALVGADPITYVLVSMLAVGTSVLFSGAAFGGRLITMFRRHPG